jgi:hypothetical protein
MCDLRTRPVRLSDTPVDRRELPDRRCDPATSQTGGVSYDAMSPVGLAWGYLGLLMASALVVGVVVLVLATRRHLSRTRRGLVTGVALAAPRGPSSPWGHRCA